MATVTRTPGPGRANLEAVFKYLETHEAAAGWFNSAVYPDGTPVAYVAVIQEFGAPEQGIPSRSYQRVTIAERQAGWSVLFAKGIRAALAGRIDPEAVLNGLGLQVAGDMRKTLSQITTPELKESTLRARARRRGVDIDSVNRDPLRDTNVMVDTLNNQTRERNA